jgi:hypothetical protein
LLQIYSWWLDPKDPHRVAYVHQGLLGPTVSTFWTFNPAYVEIRHVAVTSDDS